MIGTGSPATHEGLRDHVRALAPTGVDLALEIAGSGVLPELIDLAASPDHVITIADVLGARQHNVRFSRGDTGRATYALAQVADMVAAGAFTAAVGRTFPLTAIAQEHRSAKQAPSEASSSTPWTDRSRHRHAFD